MPDDKNELSEIDVQEVSLVGKAANGKRFLLFKSANVKGDSMKERAKPAGAPVRKKQDLEDMIRKAVSAEVAPLREENAELRKSLELQTTALRHKEYVAIAKSDFAALGDPEEVAKDIAALEALPQDQRKRILKTMKKTSAMKEESIKVLGKRLGVNTATLNDATAAAEIHALAKNLIEKSGEKMDLAVARSRIREMHPDLAAREAQEYAEGVI